MGGRGGRGGGIAIAGLGMLLTVVEFLLGMWSNLYERLLPSSITSAFSNPYLSIDRALAAHVAVGVLLGLLALGLALWGALRHRPRVLFAGLGALVGILVAAGSGELFLSKGDPIYSFLMALGFLIAFGSFSGALTVLRRHGRWAPGVWSPMGGPGSAPPSTPPPGAPPS